MSGFPCTELLASVPGHGYPAEYLYSRIRGRRSRLTADWRRAVSEISSSGEFAPSTRAERTSSTAWRALLQEYRWVFGQMDRSLRNITAPFFFYAEIRTICICLRRGAGNVSDVGDLLAASMLSERIKSFLRKGKSAEDMLDALERATVRPLPEFIALSEVAKTKGLRAAEQEMTNRYLAAVSSSDLHPLVRFLFRCIADARNILSSVKALRLDRAAKPPVLSGGSIAERRLREIVKKGDPAELVSLVRKTTGSRIDVFETAKIEGALYRWISREMRKRGRDPLGVGLVLEYLWRCSVEAMNRSVLVHTKELEREAVMAEMVY